MGCAVFVGDFYRPAASQSRASLNLLSKQGVTCSGNVGTVIALLNWQVVARQINSWVAGWAIQDFVILNRV